MSKGAPVVLAKLVAEKKIDGVIHGASSSGHTLFVEPLETIDLNNDLVRLTEEELRESHRVLRRTNGNQRRGQCREEQAEGDGV